MRRKEGRVRRRGRDIENLGEWRRMLVRTVHGGAKRAIKRGGEVIGCML